MSDSASIDDTRPLYLQVREHLKDRIKAGQWRPGQLIPNEFEIAAEFDVSQGTARKAIDLLAFDGLVNRVQGKGTYIVEHTEADVLFKFFQFYDRDGRQALPGSPDVKPVVRKGTPDECAALNLDVGADVIIVHRMRTCCGRPFSVETVVLSAERFPGLATAETVPNTLYDHFQKHYGILVARADDMLSVTAADEVAATALGIAVGTPLMHVERTAYDLNDQPLEWRISVVHMKNTFYRARLK